MFHHQTTGNQPGIVCVWNEPNPLSFLLLAQFLNGSVAPCAWPNFHQSFGPKNVRDMAKVSASSAAARLPN